MPSLVLILLTLQLCASFVNVNAGWSSLGCFIDDTQARVLHHIAGSFSNNSISSCLGVCAALGFVLGGVEYGHECYCGNAILYGYGNSPQGSCSYSCPGNQSETCGGSNTISIYRNGDLPFTVGPASLLSSWGGWDVTQCWQDDTWTDGWPRLLPHWPNDPIPAEEMSVQRCIIGCDASHYTTAGLEWGQECCEFLTFGEIVTEFTATAVSGCGNVTYPPGQSTSSQECNMPCLGDATQACGGPKRATLYKKRI